MMTIGEPIVSDTESAERQGRVERVEAKIESQADRLARIERALESALDRFSKAIDDLRDEIADSRRVNYAPMAIGVTILLFVAGGYMQTTNDKIREAAEAGDNRLAAMIESNSDVIRVRHADTMDEIARMRADYDTIRERMLDEFTKLHERTRYEQGKYDMDRQWMAEWRRDVDSRLDRIEPRNP